VPGQQHDLIAYYPEKSMDEEAAAGNPTVQRGTIDRSSKKPE